MSEKLTSRQIRAIAALLESPTLGEAATKASISPRTMHRWLDDPDFRTGLTLAESESIDRVARRLVVLADRAVDALESVLTDPGQDGAGNKRLSAGTILDNLLKLRSMHSLEERVAALEAAEEWTSRG